MVQRMKYLIGYQQPRNTQMSFLELLNPYWENISEIFFPWIDSASGRSALGVENG